MHLMFKMWLYLSSVFSLATWQFAALSVTTAANLSKLIFSITSNISEARNFPVEMRSESDQFEYLMANLSKEQITNWSDYLLDWSNRSLDIWSIQW